MVVVIPLLEEPESAPVRATDEFPKEETAFEKVFKATDEEHAPGKPARHAVCCSVETSMKTEGIKHGNNNNLWAWLKEHKIVIEPMKLDLGKAEKPGSSLRRHPSCTNQAQLVAETTKIPGAREAVRW
jgi:hypothetical protein